MNNSKLQKLFIFITAIFLSSSLFSMMPRVAGKVFQPTSAIVSTLYTALRPCSGKTSVNESEELKVKTFSNEEKILDKLQKLEEENARLLKDIASIKNSEESVQKLQEDVASIKNSAVTGGDVAVFCIGALIGMIFFGF
ncbi:MAG TPA: hypothetical protein VLG50_04760 [Candidatus Saccharimonadales bacterium]|nr:hypothetical protein [Candidatus Saccharimonadales bacterium]